MLPSGSIRFATTALLGLAAMACHNGGGVPIVRSGAPAGASPGTEQQMTQAAALSGTLGASPEFAVARVEVAYGPERVTYELQRPAYVTVLSVTDDRIEAIVPDAGKRSELVGSGSRIVGLNREANTAVNAANARFRGMDTRGVAPNDVTMAQMQEYNRCVARARQISANRRAAKRPIIGYDSLGRAIYGPAPTIDDPGDFDFERQCRYPTPARPTPGPAAQRQAPQAGRYLLIYTSDTPVEHRDVLELVVTGGDVRSIATTVGRKLFDLRGALLSVTYLPW
ncbi:MAG: hypothetical protein O2973_13055 [Gemmatimonadetes bacterium]|nr:hypothetical protein [Gemmatimonadota bacterium]